MRLIDADALKEKAWDADTRCGYVQVVDVGDIDNAPTIERKTGIWRRAEYGYTCNQCGKTHTTRTAYCPSCGAEMDC